MSEKPADWKPNVSIPSEILDDPEAFEILRVWASKKKQVVSLRGLHVRDPKAWGMFVADLVRHIARSYQLNYNDDFDDTVDKIRAAFNDEMDDATDEGEGHLREKDH